MAKVYKTAMGKPVDMDMLRLANEGIIAVGNMRTNARGDELGPGGKIVKTRSQLMSEYHQLNTPMAADEDPGFEPPTEAEALAAARPAGRMKTPVAEDVPAVEDVTPTPSYTKPRGSLADAVAQQTEVKQELLDPAPSRNGGSTGVQRI